VLQRLTTSDLRPGELVDLTEAAVHCKILIDCIEEDLPEDDNISKLSSLAVAIPPAEINGQALVTIPKSRYYNAVTRIIPKLIIREGGKTRVATVAD
jgi:hypothetical protein